jgi:hypothetical protein
MYSSYKEEPHLQRCRAQIKFASRSLMTALARCLKSKLLYEQGHRGFGCHCMHLVRRAKLPLLFLVHGNPKGIDAVKIATLIGVIMRGSGPQHIYNSPLSDLQVFKSSYIWWWVRLTGISMHCFYT